MGNFNDFTAYGYEVIRELGANRGAGRTAYLAREIDSEQFVVIKQFQFAQGSGWDGHKEIDREVKILQQLKHPNIPRYLSSFETPQSSCIVQEYIDGKPLSEIISNQQLYTPEQVKKIILKLLEVLVYLQKTFTDPVLHRDIKPANILIDRSGEPYLIDFGGARVSEGVGGSTVSVGTLGFMPPEQRFQQFNKTTDLYSLGMSIVCWLTRTEPTEMHNIINISNNQVIGLRESLSTYSLQFVDWLRKVVQPNQKDRYPDAEAAFDAFKPLHIKQVSRVVVKHLETKIASNSESKFTPIKLGKQMMRNLLTPDNIAKILIVSGSVASIAFVMCILGITLCRIIIRAMFPHAEQAAINERNNPYDYSSDSSLPTSQNPQPSVTIPPSTTANNYAQSSKRAMTWRVLNTATVDGKKYVLFGSDNLTNPYQGDTDINEFRSLLCIQKNNLPAPLGLPIATTTPGGALRGSWSGGRVLTLPNVQASTLTSQALSDEKCRLQGLQVTGENGFRMAEFHDGDSQAGGAGWDFWAKASSIEELDNTAVRYWVQINDQPANPW